MLTLPQSYQPRLVRQHKCMHSTSDTCITGGWYYTAMRLLRAGQSLRRAAVLWESSCRERAWEAMCDRTPSIRWSGADLCGLMFADARDEFLGHLLQNGAHHAGAAAVAASPEPPVQAAAGAVQKGQLSLAAQAGSPQRVQ